MQIFFDSSPMQNSSASQSFTSKVKFALSKHVCVFNMKRRLVTTKIVLNITASLLGLSKI